MRKYIVGFVCASIMLGYVSIKSREINSSKIEIGKLMTNERLTIQSDAFTARGRIPAKYTCDGADAFPPLKIDNVPAKAKTLAIICDDPDAPKGLWVHLVAFNILASAREVKGVDDILNKNGIIGTNSWDKQTWGGPCPPSGTHRYYFKVYALDVVLKLDKTARNVDLLQAMQDHVVAYGELMGLYERAKLKQ